MSIERPHYVDKIDTAFGKAELSMDQDGNIQLGPHLEPQTWATKMKSGEEIDLNWVESAGTRYNAKVYFHVDDDDIIHATTFGGSIHKSTIWIAGDPPTRITDSTIIEDIVESLRASTQAFITATPHFRKLIDIEVLENDRQEALRESDDKRMAFANSLTGLAAIDRRIEDMKGLKPIYVDGKSVMERVKTFLSKANEEQREWLVPVVAYLFLSESIMPEGKDQYRVSASAAEESKKLQELLAAFTKSII